jgi:hypothetical protein
VYNGITKGKRVNSIIELRETSPNHWRAKYQGNYGVYTIKITTDGKRRSAFSCSCPSDYYPCKHIAMIEEAIAERTAKNPASPKTGKDISAGELLKKLTHEELYDFTARIVKNNPDLSNAVLLEFSDKIETNNKNKYGPIIRRGLADVSFDDEDYYDYCMSEMPKEKYAGTMMFDGFNDLLMEVSAKVDPEAFIALQ